VRILQVAVHLVGRFKEGARLDHCDEGFLALVGAGAGSAGTRALTVGRRHQRRLQQLLERDPLVVNALALLLRIAAFAETLVVVVVEAGVGVEVVLRQVRHADVDLHGQLLLASGGLGHIHGAGFPEAPLAPLLTTSTFSAPDLAARHWPLCRRHACALLILGWIVR
jgi:hypothetical protein